MVLHQRYRGRLRGVLQTREFLVSPGIAIRLVVFSRWYVCMCRLRIGLYTVRNTSTSASFSLPRIAQVLVIHSFDHLPPIRACGCVSDLSLCPPMVLLWLAWLPCCLADTPDAAYENGRLGTAVIHMYLPLILSRSVLPPPWWYPTPD